MFPLSRIDCTHVADNFKCIVTNSRHFLHRSVAFLARKAGNSFNSLFSQVLTANNLRHDLVILIVNNTIVAVSFVCCKCRRFKTFSPLTANFPEYKATVLKYSGD